MKPSVLSDPSKPTLGVISADDISDDERAAALVCARMSRNGRVSLSALGRALGSPMLGPLVRLVSETARDRRREYLGPLSRAVAESHPDFKQSILSALADADLAAEAQPDDLEPDIPPPKIKPYSLDILGSATFGAKRYAREWAVKRLLALRQPCIVGGPKKVLKTTLMVELLVCLATAALFLGMFEVPRPRRVLFLSGESGEPTLQETVDRVLKAKDLAWADLEGFAFFGFHLPQLSSREHMEALATFIRDNAIEVVIADPLYLCLLSGNSSLDAANLFDVGPLLKQVSDTCLDAGAMPILVHHLRKNREDHTAPPELEDLAFAGVQEFARQWILIGRQEAYVPGSGQHKLWLNVGGSAGHSGLWSLDIDEGTLGEDFTGRRWDVSVTGATEARTEAKAQAVATAAERQAARSKIADEAKAVREKQDADRILVAMTGPPFNGRATKTKIRQATSLWTDRLDRALFILEHEWKVIGPTMVDVACNSGVKPSPGYAILNTGRHRETPGDTGVIPVSDTGRNTPGG